MAKDDPHFRLRIPADLKHKVEDAAAMSGRSINAEVVVRLNQSFEGYFLDMSGAGFTALVKRFEATTEALESILQQQLDREIVEYLAEENRQGRFPSVDKARAELSRRTHGRRGKGDE